MYIGPLVSDRRGGFSEGGLVGYNLLTYEYIYIYIYIDRKRPPPPGGFPIYYVPSSRTVCKRTPLEGFVPGASRGVLLHTVLDEGTW